MHSGGTVRDVTHSLLRQAGMTTIFGNPGSTELPFFSEFPGDFRYVLGLQESVVVGMADGFAQATRKPAMVNLHSAAGVGHALGNIFTAFKNQTPLVITAGQQARSILPYEPFLFAERATEFPLPYIKWAIEPARAEDVPAAIARAYYHALEPPCGPTFVSIPIDDWGKACAPLTLRSIVADNPGNPEAIAAAGQRLAAATSPALIVAAGVGRDNAWNETVALAERHDMPVAILGDGSSMYAIQGLWSAAQLNVSLSIVIVNNGRYQALETFGRLFGIQQPVGTNLPHLDFCGLAGSQGLESQRVTDAGQLDDMLEWSFSASSPTLLEVMVD